MASHRVRATASTRLLSRRRRPRPRTRTGPGDRRRPSGSPCCLDGEDPSRHAEVMGRRLGTRLGRRSHRSRRTPGGGAGGPGGSARSMSRCAGARPPRRTRRSTSRRRAGWRSRRRGGGPGQEEQPGRRHRGQQPVPGEPEAVHPRHDASGRSGPMPTPTAGRRGPTGRRVVVDDEHAGARRRPEAARGPCHSGDRAERSPGTRRPRRSALECHGLGPADGRCHAQAGTGSAGRRSVSRRSAATPITPFIGVRVGGSWSRGTATPCRAVPDRQLGREPVAVVVHGARAGGRAPSPGADGALSCARPKSAGTIVSAPRRPSTSHPTSRR